MLVLSRKEDQSILFPNLGISIEIVRVQGNKVSVGVEAPKSIRIVRGELQSAAQSGRQSGCQDNGSELQVSHVVEMLAPEAQAELRNRLNTVGLAVHAAQNQFAAGGLENAEAFLQKAVEALADLNKLFDSSPSDCVQELQPAYEITSRTELLSACDRGIPGWFTSPAHSHQLVEYLQLQLCSAN